MIISEEANILLRLVIAHLLTDFVLQPFTWVEDRSKKKFRSVKLYLHVFLTALIAYLFSGAWNNLWILVIVFTTHLLIDIWKSYQPAKLKYFLIDQFLHLLVLILICVGLFGKWTEAGTWLLSLYDNSYYLILLTGYMIITWPLGILIGITTEKWRVESAINSDGLAKAGLWIGLFERFLILTFILIDQYTAVGLLIAAKSILRFNDKESNTQKKTEYVLIGTLMSFSASVIVGLAIKALITYLI